MYIGVPNKDISGILSAWRPISIMTPWVGVKGSDTPVISNAPGACTNVACITISP
jgi:hypothetical protein